MFGATDWALKRVLKFALKRNLGRFLQTELDLEQLDVQLGTGTLELRSVLLDCEQLNKQLVGRSAAGMPAAALAAAPPTWPPTCRPPAAHPVPNTGHVPP
jgi:autophagy-related protein 2